MTLSDLVTTVPTWAFAREAGDRISKEVAAVRREYLGKSATEVMPNGNRVTCVITSIDWIQDYGLTGGWDVGVVYTDTMLKGQMSHTSDKVLVFGSK